ncbi:hypothetical protein TD95_001873 [Thielaviopsis punctulata]|uniref:Uncharacterized protein n=1 Tax=Thielaviopsis punctulata TaxID=72032 RepID=A0A0F4ZDH4_9PEZI|nr:hypothetical protein TD95_001873 [Thielaviopsis punctulata]
MKNSPVLGIPAHALGEEEDLLHAAEQAARLQEELLRILEAQEAARIASHRTLVAAGGDESYDVVSMSAAERAHQMHVDILKGTYQCVICLDSISAKTPIWSQCATCRTAFHFSCVQEWQQASLHVADSGEELWKSPCYRLLFALRLVGVEKKQALRLYLFQEPRRTRAVTSVNDNVPVDISAPKFAMPRIALPAQTQAT